MPSAQTLVARDVVRPGSAPKPGAARTRLLLEGPIVSTLLRLGAPNVSMGGAIASAIARAVGAGRREDARALVVHGLVIAAGMAAVFTTLVLVAGSAFYRLMGGHGETLAAAVDYSRAIFAGALAYWVLSALTSAVRGAGQAGVLASVYLSAEVVHVLLVPALVFGVGPIPALGVTGAGLATVASFTLSSLVLAGYLLSGRTVVTLSFRGVRLSRRLFVEILRVGAPASLTPILGNLTLAVVTGFVATLGPAALAGFGTAVRLEYVQVPLIFGLGVGVLAMAGTNIGAGQVGRAARISWIGAGVVALTYPFLGLGSTLVYAFQAAGRPLWPLLALPSRTLLVAAGAWVVIHATETGRVGLGFAAASGLVVYGFTLAVAFRGGAWKRPRAAA